MKKVLFIDRDGTLIKEPPVTFQVDNLEQLELLPGVLRNLYRISNEMDYELVIVTNQDGLGTPAYPREHFDLVQEKMLQLFRNEGIRFAAIHIDESFARERKPSRKPGTAMLTDYMKGDYDLEHSYVIGDRVTDVQLARNLGAGSIFIQNNEPLQEEQASFEARSWEDIYRFLKSGCRYVEERRTTNETDISIRLNLDGQGIYDIRTGIRFFDHMLEQLSRHGGIDLLLQVKGDLDIDEHHTIEDTAIALGQAVGKALGSKRGIERYGFCLPMDDCLAQVALDLGGRSWLVWDAVFKREKIGDMPTEMFLHFFKSFSDAAACNLNIKAEGENEHHKIEAIFKAFARALKAAVRIDPDNMRIPTTKGLL
ncbi:bifunctional histidinol-phosphatase/imidazoleglycerol-phosphate dehydratase HisB [Taibaiella chishuiensis]|uniref:Histidine biosynthesis bifunctional protein HisB n=1 Tax=Taibaiella chishuiensis TaxID=1434707 RepID=A0A2P8DBU7_9BACT|nr:bifunctional histidinol-phosphatase/imidazoleglycerol-phosphate dehydratase HisB [Taibaiella chishuiensis]PSK94674.1 imidazoleglycerol-phosphate dehydratase [Taibaiella chishuiensis]